MRVIGRNQTGQIVGCFERHCGEMIGEQFDASLRLVAQAVFAGFRESVAWLYAVGAARFEIVG